MIGSSHRLVLYQELIDMVVDYAYNDHDTLLNCSLASPLFLPSSRFHLFEELHLLSSRWAHFFDLLKSPLSTITRIQFVGLDFEDNRPDFHFVLTSLRGLGLLSITLANMRVEQCINLNWEIIGFSNLNQLTIKGGYFLDASHMFDIVSKFKSVEHLRLRQPMFNHTLTDTPTDHGCHDYSVDPKSPVRLWRTFELHNWDLACAPLFWLTLQSNISGLQTIVLTELESEDFALVGKLLRTLGPQLNYLELQLLTITFSTLIYFLYGVGIIDLFHCLC